MYKKFFILILFIFIMQGCVKKTYLPIAIDKNNRQQISETAKFDVKIIGNTVYGEKDDTIHIGDMLKLYITQELKKYNIHISNYNSKDSKYIIIVDIKSFYPGNTVAHLFLHNYTQKFLANVEFYTSICLLEDNAGIDIIGKKISYIPQIIINSSGYVGKDVWKAVLLQAATGIVETINVNILKRETN